MAFPPGRPLPAPVSVRAVLYDIDGTLYYLQRMRRLMAMELAISFARSPARTLREFRIVQAYRRAQETLRGQSGASQAETAARSLGIPESEVGPVVEEWMERRPLQILPRCARESVLDAIRLLAESGVRQAAFSDYPAQSKIEIFGVGSHFEFAVHSGESVVGEFKPSPVGFLHAAGRLDALPSEMIYVGDRPEVDGAGATAAGMKFVHVDEISPDRVRRARLASPDEVCPILFGL